MAGAFSSVRPMSSTPLIRQCFRNASTLRRGGGGGERRGASTEGKRNKDICETDKVHVMASKKSRAAVAAGRLEIEWLVGDLERDGRAAGPTHELVGEVHFDLSGDEGVIKAVVVVGEVH